MVYVRSRYSNIEGCTLEIEEARGTINVRGSVDDEVINTWKEEIRGLVKRPRAPTSAGIWIDTSRLRLSLAIAHGDVIM